MLKVNRAKLLGLAYHTKGTGFWYPAQCIGQKNGAQIGDINDA